VFFEELVEQHRVHRLVAHSVNFPLTVASHQSGIDLFHFLGHEAKLRDAFGIKLVLVAEGDRFERENRFARLVHRLDVVLETLRGKYRAELTVGIYNYPYASCNRCPANAGDKGGRLGSFGADADGAGLASTTNVADINIVIARSKKKAGCFAQTNVTGAGGVAKKRVKTVGRVIGASGIRGERLKATSRVIAAGGVAKERLCTIGRVSEAGGVPKERLKPGGHVMVTRRI